MRFIGFFALVGLLVLMLSPRARAAVRQRLPAILLYGAGGLLILLAVTGRLPWLFGILGGVLATAMRLLPLALQLPGLASLWRRARGHEEPGAGHSGESGAPAGAGRMTPREAREVLGVNEDASREEISAAHRRLIQRLHPDRGGTAGIASRINEARDTLLGRRSAA